MASRLITDECSKSDKLPQLSPDALNLFYMMIPHLSVHGKMPGDPHYVKGIVVPKFKRFTPTKIEKYLGEISRVTNVKWFQVKGLWYIHSLNFTDHQPNLRLDRAGKDTLPDFPGENSQVANKSQLPDIAGSMSGELQPRKYEVEEEREGEVEGRKAPKGPLSDEDFIQKLKDNPAYKHINFETELAKMDAWLMLPKNKHRKKTGQFIINWLNKIDRPMETGPPADQGGFKLCTATNPMPEGARDSWRHPEAKKISEDRAQCPHCKRIWGT